MKVRKRVFSLDTTEFPGLDDLDKIGEDLGPASSQMKGKGKNDSGVKFKSHVSTTGSFTDPKLDEPLICEETKQTLNKFEKYMIAKDAESSVHGSANSPTLRPQWKFKPPSFFEMETKHQVKGEQQDWEYLSNPEGYEMSPQQKEFL